MRLTTGSDKLGPGRATGKASRTSASALSLLLLLPGALVTPQRIEIQAPPDAKLSAEVDGLSAEAQVKSQPEQLASISIVPLGRDGQPSPDRTASVGGSIKVTARYRSKPDFERKIVTVRVKREDGVTQTLSVPVVRNRNNPSLFESEPIRLEASTPASRPITP